MRWIAYATLLVAFLALYAALVQGAIPPSLLYSSDTLWVDALAQDIHDLAPLRDWDFPPNPYFFPDLALYLALHLPISFIVDDIHWRITLFALAQTAIFAAGWLWLQRQLTARRMRGALLRAQTALTLAVVLGCVAAGRNALLSHALTGVFHFGVLVVMPWTLGLLLVALDAPRTMQRSTLPLAGVSLLAALSDTLYIVQVVVPALGALAILGIVRAAGWRRIGAVAAALVASSLAGYALNHLVLEPRTELYVQPQQWQQALAALAAWAWESAQRSPWLAAFWLASLAATIFVYALDGIQVRRNRETSAEVRRAFVVGAFALISVFVSLASVVVAGNFTGDATTRYILPAGFMPLLIGWPLASAHLAQNGLFDSPLRRRFATLATGVACVAVLIALAARHPFPAWAAPTFDDPKVHCIDEQAQRLGLRTGVATYWQALYTTALSASGLRVLQVNPDLSVYYWNNNLVWYDTEIDFVIADTEMPPAYVIDADQIKLRFGPPAESFTCGSATILVYNRPGDLQFRRYVRSQPARVRVHAEDASFTFPGYALPTWIGGLSIGMSKAASEAWGNVEGFLAIAAFADLPRGDYSYELHVFSDNDDTGAWEIAEYERNPGIVTAPPRQSGSIGGSIDGSGRQVIGGTFANDRRANIALRIRYHGHGTLFVDKIRLRRLGDGPTPPPLFTADSPPAGIENHPDEPTLRLIEPRADAFLPDAWTDFAWQWTGPQPSQGQAFEVRLWQEGDPYPFGAHDAAADRAQTRHVGDVYMLRLDVNGAHAVQTHGAGEYLWTVALVELEPAYRDVGIVAPPQCIHIVR